MEEDFLSITTNVKPKLLSIQRLESFSTGNWGCMQTDSLSEWK